MMFSQSYPIFFYSILLVTVVFVATLIVFLKSKKRSNTIVVLPDSIEPEILSTIDGIAKNFEIAKHSELKMVVRSYNTGIYVIDPYKNLDEQIKRLKEIRENFDNFHAIVLGKLKENKRKELRKFSKNVKFIEKNEIKEMLSSLL